MTAPTPRDTGPALDPRAVEAAAEALHDAPTGCSRGPACPVAAHSEHRLVFRREAEAAVAAAAPILLAAERQRIAVGLRALNTGIGHDGCRCAACLIRERAARIAEVGT